MNGNDFDKKEYSENDYAFKIVNNNGRPKTYGWSVAAMVFGILSVICCCFGFASLIFGICAVVFSIISSKKLGYFDGMCISGLVLGIIGFVLGAAMIAANIFMDATFMEEYRKILDEYLKSMEAAQ